MIALVTGGSRGIGAAIAKQLAEAGHDVVLTYRGGVDAAEATAKLCRDCGVQALALQADIASEAASEALVSRIRSELGPISILVNNAGVNRDGLMLRMKTEQFSEVIETNLTGAFILSRLVVPDMMKARHGRIINITSVAGIYGNAGQANYSAAKAGLIGLTKSMSRELGSRNITVNAVAPGFIDTDMTAALPEKLRTGALERISLGRFGEPADVAGLVAFLASDAAAYITGQVVEVSGGLSL
ncbi:MAG: 3-oxoacyl-[acyl-carrier-protein] reductase [Ruminococcaceae bacterium]|nr:3-oxoacyl-[acyl-carrier-protein] reductase [Oscillospiraceae bacterium]